MQNMHVMQTNLSMNNKHCHDMQKKMQHRIVISKMQNIQYLQKNMLMISKKTLSIKHDRIFGKNAILSVYHAVFGGYHPV